MTTKNPPEQTTTILNASLAEFVSDIVEHAKMGWEFDEESPPRMVGWMYEALLWRNPTEEQRAMQPPRTRAEILAAARAAKAAKALERAQASGEEPTPSPTDDAPY